MKLIFKKSEDPDVSVYQDIDGEEKDFSYVEMIKSLINSKSMEKPTLVGDFTEAEDASINRMVDKINDEIAKT